MKFTGRGIPYEDLVQVGYLALIKAIDRFDTSKNVKLSTFATSYILGGIKHHFRDNGWQVKISRRLKNLHGRILKDREYLTNHERTILDLRYKYNLTQSEIAQKLDISQMHVSRLLRYSLIKMRKCLKSTKKGNNIS